MRQKTETHTDCLLATGKQTPEIFWFIINKVSQCFISPGYKWPGLLSLTGSHDCRIQVRQWCTTSFPQTTIISSLFSQWPWWFDRRKDDRVYSLQSNSLRKIYCVYVVFDSHPIWQTERVSRTFTWWIYSDVFTTSKRLCECIWLQELDLHRYCTGTAAQVGLNEASKKSTGAKRNTTVETLQ